MKFDNTQQEFGHWATVVPSFPGGHFGAYDYVPDRNRPDTTQRIMRIGYKARILGLSKQQSDRLFSSDEKLLEELVQTDPNVPGMFLISNTCHLVMADTVVLPIVPRNGQKRAQLFEFKPVD